VPPCQPSAGAPDHRAPARRTVAGLVLGLAACSAGAPPPVTVAPSPIRTVIEQLVEEARGPQSTLSPPGGEPDFARRPDAPPPPPPADVAQAIAGRTHPDPFIDAYVRWQLTSYRAPLGDLDDEQFAMLAGNMPPLLDNPRAGQRYVRFMRHMLEQGPLDDQERELVELRLADVGAQSLLVAGFYPIADRLWRWVDDQLAPTPARRLTWRLAHAAAAIRAGWPAAPLIGRVDQTVAAVAAGPGLTEPERAAFSERLRAARMLERTLILDAAMGADGAVSGRIALTRIGDEDASRWTAALAPPPPEPEPER
jgi:hypothetical protein